MINRTVFRLVNLLLIVFLTACASSGPTKTDNLRAADMNAQLGNGYLAQGNYELAKTKFEKALKQNPKQAYAHAGYALMWGRLGETDKAEKHFKKALKLDPRNPEILNNYGTYLCSQKQFAKAEKQFMAALNDPLYQTPEFAYANAGRCSILNSDYDKAESFFGKALQVNPHFPDALFQMALVNEQRGNYRVANAYIQKYEVDGTHTAESLWLAMQITAKLGDKNAAASYRMKLKNMFPNSKQAARLKAVK
ncbi:MAG: type IV pilus biogenesis/stability protein PilW [Gammaproteobacteria bacterium]|nr:type IV pilus biogenesis/stability protein PilW [Gammaproteobacteria bacterium]